MSPQSNKEHANSKRVEQSGSTHSGAGVPPNQPHNSIPAHESGDPPHVDLLQHEEQDFRNMGAWASIDITLELREHGEICETISNNAHHSDY
jgi:hypothetical protein